jgi:hypothetical protein
MKESAMSYEPRAILRSLLPARSPKPVSSQPLPKLLQESHIALKEQLDVIDAVFQNRNPLHAHAEGESRNFDES